MIMNEYVLEAVSQKQIDRRFNLLEVANLGVRQAAISSDTEVNRQHHV